MCIRDSSKGESGVVVRAQYILSKSEICLKGKQGRINNCYYPETNSKEGIRFVSHDKKPELYPIIFKGS